MKGCLGCVVVLGALCTTLSMPLPAASQINLDAGLVAGRSTSSAVSMQPNQLESASGRELASGIKLQLHYDAYLGGLNVGTAQIQVSTANDAYSLVGSARSVGLWERFQQWRATFGAEGVREAIKPSPKSFFSTQTTPQKQREVLVENGLLYVTKNLKKRSPREALPGIDMLSALFFMKPCNQQMQVHTGRDGYEFRLLANADRSSCQYAVRSDEDRDYEMQIDYQRVAELMVPRRIEISGGLSGYLVLAQVSADASVQAPP